MDDIIIHVIPLGGDNRDSKDADVVPNATDYTIVLNRVTSWFNTKPGFIELQHTIDPFTNGVAITALKEIISMGGIKNQMMPVRVLILTSTICEVTSLRVFCLGASMSQ